MPHPLQIAVNIVYLGIVGLCLTWPFTMSAVAQVKTMDTESNKDSPFGFKDFVKNPELFQRTFEKSKKEPTRLSAEEIDRVVERLLDPRDRDAVELLKGCGAAAIPALVRASGDKRYRVIEESKSYLPSSPLERVLDLLEDYHPKDVVANIAPLVNDPNKHFRTIAGIALASIGSDDTIASVKISLADKDQHVRAMTLIGIRRSFEAMNASPFFLREIFETLTSIVSNPAENSYEIFNYAPNLLLDIDRDRAVKVLTKKGMLERSKPGLCDILGALNKHEIAIPKGQLDTLSKSLRLDVDKYPFSYAYGETLIAVARTEGQKTEPIIREAIAWKKEGLSERAAQALCVLRGLSDPSESVCKRCEDLGFERLSLAEQQYFAVGLLKGEVDNGGFSQYFFNSSGAYAREALSGLKAINAEKTVEIMRDAMATFGKDGPSRDRAARQDQLAKLFTAQDKEFERLDKQFYASKERIYVLMLLYVADHAKDFQLHAKN